MGLSPEVQLVGQLATMARQQEDKSLLPRASSYHRVLHPQAQSSCLGNPSPQEVITIICPLAERVATIATVRMHGVEDAQMIAASTIHSCLRVNKNYNFKRNQAHLYNFQRNMLLIT